MIELGFPVTCNQRGLADMLAMLPTCQLLPPFLLQHPLPPACLPRICGSSCLQIEMPLLTQQNVCRDHLGMKAGKYWLLVLVPTVFLFGTNSYPENKGVLVFSK